MRILGTERGLSIVITLLALLMLAVFAGALFSLVTTSTNIGLQELRGTQAFSLAEGGLEVAHRSLTENLEWYRSASDPIAPASQTLGAGSFTVLTYLPATMLRTRIPTAASTAPVRVYSTARFPAAGVIQVEDDIDGSAEFIRYTGTTADTFTGITRNITLGGISGSASAHERSERVYPVTTLVSPLAGNCAVIPNPFQIVAHPKFLGAGTITVLNTPDAGATINAEEISYSGSRVSGGNLILEGVLRCRNGTVVITALAGDPVTVLLVDGVSPDFEAEVVADGTADNALRKVRRAVQR